MIVIYSLLVVLSTILIYSFFDVNYFLRMAFIICWSKLFYKKQNILEKSVNYGICLTSDIDIFFNHMNNARYVRELDFARSYFYDRTGIFWEIKKKGCSIMQAATSIRYRRPMRVFRTYKITTELIYWDDKNLYLQHEFIKLADNFVHTTVLSKQSLTGSNARLTEIIKKIYPEVIKPILTEELRLWFESLKKSSLKFKKVREDQLETGTLSLLADPYN